MGLADEFKTIELGDPRLNRRAVLLAERLGQKPSASIPNACTSWAETAAAYRFLRNEQVSWDKVLGHTLLAGLPVRAQHFVPADLFVAQEAIGRGGFGPAGAGVGDAG